MKQASVEAHAKINLTLDVTGKRPNGYHDVCMVMQSIGIHDNVTVCIHTGTNEILLTSSNTELPMDHSNLAYRAAELFLREMELPCDGVLIEIEKHNPIAAGLAGGSTDAAAVLWLLDYLFETHLGQEKLMEMGLKLGADVPFCMVGGTMLAEGIGEMLTPLPAAPQVELLVCKPPFAVSTPAIYKAIDSAQILERPDTAAMIKALQQQNTMAMAAQLCNVMQPITAEMHPEVNEICAVMKQYGALEAVMSGSGPSVFGIFTDRKLAEKARNALSEQYEETFLTNFSRKGQIKR